MESIWNKTVEIPNKKSLAEDIHVKNVVIGAGMAGILTTWSLMRRGQEVIVLESNEIGSGQSGYTTAKITSQHGLFYDRMIRLVGKEAAREYAVAKYDRQDEGAKYHIALQRGPIMLAQENRLGYSVDEPMSFAVQPDDTIEAILPKQDIAPYEHMVEVCVPLTDGRTVHLTDYASAGKTWNTDSKMAVWMLTKKAQN